MLTKIKISNFKRFNDVEIELGNPVVFIGPNNSGKTSTLQALALWQIGLNRWNEKRGGGKLMPSKRPGVTINRKDLMAAPVPNANLLWRDLHVRDVRKTNGSPETQNVRIDILVEGVSEDKAWACGFEFDYANNESFYCRPLRAQNDLSAERMLVPEGASQLRVAFLPPMSGLASREDRLDPGSINVRIGEGKTAEVLRNLCYRVLTDNPEAWAKLEAHLQRLFGVTLEPPQYVEARGELVMSYTENGVQLDLSCAGRGLQQTLLLLAFMYANPRTVVLLDEPDAHLEILRQRQIYQLLVDVARENGNQVIAASHSEVLLNEAGGRDVVIAFIGRPHRLNDRGSQLLKSLREIGFDQYALAQQTGWVIYLEGSSDLAILQALSKRLEFTEAIDTLDRPFVHYVGNQPTEVRRHFHGLREAVPSLRGIALFDRLESNLPDDLGAKGLTWHKREIENYLCFPETLEAFARQSAEIESAGPLFSAPESERRLTAMKSSIEKVTGAIRSLRKPSPWSPDCKVSNDFLEPLFADYFEQLSLPNIMAKKNFCELAALVPVDKIDAEIREKLELIVATARLPTT